MILADSSFVVSSVGSALTLIALCVAIWQITRTRKAANAALAASKGSARYISRSVMLALLPQLASIEDELRHAVQSGHTPSTLQAVVRWREAAAQLQGLAESRGGYDDFAQELRTSVALAATAEGLLTDPTKIKDPADVTRQARKQIRQVTIVSAQLIGKLPSEVDEETH